mgnify:CR=1 FL=1
MDSSEYVQMLTDTLTEAATNFAHCDGIEGLSVDRQDETKFNARFLLPFCDAVVQSEVSSRKCIDIGCAGYIVATLASHDLELRKLAFHATARLLDKVTADSAFAHRFQVSTARV